MGSKRPSPVTTVHVTGFKKFHGVADNPTERIVRNLQQFMDKRGGMPKGLVLGSCTVLDAAGQGALAPLQDLFDSAVLGRDLDGSPNQGQVILLHFGANSGSHRFALDNKLQMKLLSVALKSWVGNHRGSLSCHRMEASSAQDRLRCQ